MTSPTIITRCMVCGRRLTNPDSVKRGIGPVCLRRLKKNQKLDYFMAVSPSKNGYAVDDAVVINVNYKWGSLEPLPTCPRCGRVSPNPNYCTYCGSPIKARTLEVAA